jgi:hypothetical protein
MPVSPGRVGPGAARFVSNGSNCVVLADDPVLLHPMKYTLALWAQVQSTSAALVAKPALLGTSYSVDAFYEATRMTARAGVTVVAGTQPGSGWHHEAITYDGGTVRLYTDGVQIHSTTVPAAVSYGSAAYLVGCDLSATGTGQSYLDATLDDVRFYNRVLTDAEIAALAN